MKNKYFGIGTKVSWSKDAPIAWQSIYTTGPMEVIGIVFHDGTPSDYAKKFSCNGMAIEPGYLYEVQFNPSGDYYDPPLSLIAQHTIKMVVHEKWLEKLTM